MNTDQMPKLLLIFPLILLLGACSSQEKATSGLEASWIENIPADSQEYLYSLGKGESKRETLSCKMAHTDAITKIGQKIEYKLSMLTSNYAAPIEPVGKDMHLFAQAPIDTLFSDDFLTKVSEIDKEQINTLEQPGTDGPIYECIILNRSSTPEIIEAIDRSFAKHDSIYALYKQSTFYPLYNSDFHKNFESLR